MHTYSTDNDFRVTLLGLLGVAAYVIVYVLNVYFFPFLNRLIPIDIPELLFIGLAYSVVFSAVYKLFATKLWNQSWIPSFVVAVPDLTGHWEGTIQTNFEGEIEEEYLTTDGSDGSEGQYHEMEATLDIQQSWWKIAIMFETGRSTSYSTGANFQMERKLQPRLSYLFQNEGPSPEEQSESEGKYTGAAEFRVLERDGETMLEGEYYTGTNREHSEGPGEVSRTNYGSAEFKRVRDEPMT